MSFYEALAGAARRNGFYAARGRFRAANGTEGSERMRKRLRGEMERIVLREAEMKLAPTVKFREERFGGVLFETRQERVFCLNATAAAVARELSQGTSEPEIVEKMRTRFEDPSGSIEKEARDFLATLKSEGLVEG